MKRQLSQEEIDDYFQAPGDGERGGDAAAVPFDFRRLDGIPKEQLSVIHFLHETFVRTLSTSLSVYLRSYVSGDLISVEQLPYGDFAENLTSPTCIACLSMQPYDGCSLVEVNQSLLATILDHVLGGNGKMRPTPDREITDIEQDMLEGFYRIIAHDLSEAWKPIAPLRFAVDSLDTTPQLSQRIARNEAVVAVAMELRIGDNAGVMNLAIPSVALKAMRQRFDQQGASQKAGSQLTAMAIQKKLARDLMLKVECELSGASIRVGDLLSLESGDVLDLGMPVDSAMTALVNGQPHFQGEIVANGPRTAMVVRSVTQV
ncbi:MAG: flagellar motor switch protein FliM [Bryobacteraceae bacterium]|jgi:flagellar motor switch protein FliM